MKHNLINLNFQLMIRYSILILELFQQTLYFKGSCLYLVIWLNKLLTLEEFMKKQLPLIILILIFVSLNTNAQNTYEFLRLDMSARAGALGGSFVSNNDDPDVIFYNPAGMQLLTDNPISFSFVKHLLDINF